ncbi:PEP-CTERM sorting domain-containing protein [Mitsuaria sp. TWR114]|uniref:PEP-CTERM sorting domain-containing protein n=1 Tax=Mitsuaria sp. TWR114 TaxID=2601731 RepID=UPI0038579EAE
MKNWSSIHPRRCARTGAWGLADAAVDLAAVSADRRARDAAGLVREPPRVSIGPPPTGSPPTAIPPPPLFVLPPAVTELPPTVAPPLAAPPVVPVPEPSTSAMVIAGLGLLIASLRRSCRARSRCRAQRGADERVGLRKMPTAHDVLSRPIRC